MSATTAAGAIADLVAALAPGGTPAVAGVTAVHDHEPRMGDRARPVALTVSFAGMTATDWRLSVRLWVDASADVAAAQATLTDLTPAVDALLSGPRSAWSVAVEVPGDDSRPAAFVCETALLVGREDF